VQANSPPPQRIIIGQVPIDVVTFPQALDAVVGLVRRGTGGFVVTPNIDHVVLAEENPGFAAAYAAAQLSLADGQPLVWVSGAVGQQLPDKISGSDFVEPLMERAAREGLRVYLLGAGDGVAQKAAQVLKLRYGTQVVGFDAPKLSATPDLAGSQAVLEKLRAARPDLVLVALGAPKQELWMHACVQGYAPAVALGIGASLDFIAGTVPRAPAWMARAGLEWAYRLSREPRRLWRRYLVQDPKFLLILARTLSRPLAQRVISGR
jgi:N-acetylglucosaminyldiphosphoundecaprenol N-acetyl-beta-D-mannosaminyltransferase